MDLDLGIVGTKEWIFESGIANTKTIKITNESSEIDLQNIEIIFETKNPNISITGNNVIPSDSTPGLTRYKFKFGKDQIIKRDGDSYPEEYQITTNLIEIYYKEAKFDLTIIILQNGIELKRETITITVRKKT